MLNVVADMFEIAQLTVFSPYNTQVGPKASAYREWKEDLSQRAQWKYRYYSEKECCNVARVQYKDHGPREGLKVDLQDQEHKA